MKTSDFNYILPKELIAQEPWPNRDQCCMLVLDKKTGNIEDKHFFDIYNYLEPGDLLIANETRVLPARLLGKKRGSGGEAEILLLTNISEGKDGCYWEALVKPGRRLKPESKPIIDFYKDDKILLSAHIVDWGKKEGMRVVKLTSDIDIDTALHTIGNTPLPPYIHGYSGDMEMYQTVYSANESSAAAPTAGLHFTKDLIKKLKDKGVLFKTVELEVGIDTFKPVDEDDPKDHKMHSETYSISQDVIDAIYETKKNGKKVIAVGTTSVRTLESAAVTGKLVPCFRNSTSLFILPGYKFKVIDALITNFHVPQSTLMMLVSAFAGYENIMDAYKHAVDNKYRFLSFGDAMFITDL